MTWTLERVCDEREDHTADNVVAIPMKFKIEWESPYDDALYVVNVMDSNGQLNDFPMTVDEKEVSPFELPVMKINMHTSNDAL